MKYHIKKKISLKTFNAYKEKARKEKLGFSRKEIKEMKQDLLRGRKKFKWLDKKTVRVANDLNDLISYVETLDLGAGFRISN